MNIMPLQNTLCHCRTHYATAEHIMPLHNTLCHFRTHYATAEHIMPLQNTSMSHFLISYNQ